MVFVGEMSTAFSVIFAVFGTLWITFGALLFFRRCLFLMAGYITMTEEQKEDYGEYMRIWTCVVSLILGFGIVIGPLSFVFSWVIGVSAGIIIGTTVFSLVYVLTRKRSKK